MSESTLAHVARLYYVRGLTKLEIAEWLGISRFKVARLLDQARDEGIVRVEIADPVPVDDELSHALEQAFGLRMAVVVPEELLAQAAAAWLPELLHPGDVLGVAWGQTLSQVAEHLAVQDFELPVVQICGAIAGYGRGTSPAEVALRFTEKLGGPLYPLPVPALTSSQTRRDLLANPAVEPTIEMFDQISVALVGIGVRPKGKGHVLVHVFDEQGRFESDLDAIALSIDQLASVRLMAAAGGSRKQKAVLGALRTGFVDVLVTDESCARYALG